LGDDVLISVHEIKKEFGVKPKVVLHVGAHKAEESESMKAQGWGAEKTIWVESQVILAQALEEKFRNSTSDIVLNATVWSKSGVAMTFYENSNSESSSLYKLGSHADYFPDIIPTQEYKVITSRLDQIISSEDKIDFVNLDIQGAELQALLGLGKLLDTVTEIYTEVNKGEVYKECAKVWEIDSYLHDVGFRRIATRWAKGADWGDALYTRNFNYVKFIKFAFLENIRIIITSFRYLLHDLKIFLLKEKS
jgi:FkbM family methyltransferase